MSIVSGSNKTFSPLRRLPWYAGAGLIIAGIATRAGTPFPRARVWLINRRTASLVAATSADSNGYYVFRNIAELPGDTEGYIVLGFDDSKTYDPEAKDFIQPEADA